MESSCHKATLAQASYGVLTGGWCSTAGQLRETAQAKGTRALVLEYHA